jgi:hypothetical protein
VVDVVGAAGKDWEEGEPLVLVLVEFPTLPVRTKVLVGNTESGARACEVVVTAGVVVGVVPFELLAPLEDDKEEEEDFRAVVFGGSPGGLRKSLVVEFVALALVTSGGWVGALEPTGSLSEDEGSP